LAPKLVLIHSIRAGRAAASSVSTPPSSLKDATGRLVIASSAGQGPDNPGWYPQFGAPHPDITIETPRGR